MGIPAPLDRALIRQDKDSPPAVYFSSSAQYGRLAIAAKPLGGVGTEDTMKMTGTVDQVLKHKIFNKVLLISPEQTVRDALSVMAEFDIGALMVTSEAKLVGILSERDYARKGVLLGHDSSHTKVSEIMTRQVVSVTPQHTVADCMNLMTEGRFRHLPVLEGDRVVGIVSIGDLVKWIISDQQRAIEALEGYITGGYPG